MDVEKALKDLSPKVQIDIALNIILEHCCFAHFGSGEKELVDHFMHNLDVMHPTHKQDFGRFIMKIMEYYSKQHDLSYYDLRDEAVCRMFDRIWKANKDNPLPRF